MACSVGDDPHERKLFMNSLGMKCACGCEGEPDVAKFARRLDAVGSEKGKVTFTSRLDRPTVEPEYRGWGTRAPLIPPGPVLEATIIEAKTFDLGSRPRGAPQIDTLFAHHTISWNAFSIVSLVRNMPEARLRPDEVEAIVSELTQRFDKLLREAIEGTSK